MLDRFNSVHTYSAYIQHFPPRSTSMETKDVGAPRFMSTFEFVIKTVDTVVCTAKQNIQPTIQSRDGHWLAAVGRSSSWTVQEWDDLVLRV